MHEVGVGALVAEGGVNVRMMESELRPKSRHCSWRSSRLGRQAPQPGGVLKQESAAKVDRNGSHGWPGHEVLAVGHDGS
eukprot:4752239-Pyramimonas_sp.AAC.1